ncbi:hypothetical protein N3K66_005194 [Trichothecium roseum]|uniref:Uncharacterized protein n=1 Tax=Trichothecium roseum TaxID=47278 RepID=A0ACC0V3Q6_9HYPO|nr:hypothetical protein N3K66_005194 [Trichothecium roseum]
MIFSSHALTFSSIAAAKYAGLSAYLSQMENRVYRFYKDAFQLMQTATNSRPLQDEVPFRGKMSSVGCTVKADDDDTEFILNIFSDFGPILALFGDQFARQFASESLTLLDHVIFACVPLGIVTALIGAIRVQGPKFAKAFIGRARENRSTVELELMSSTSDNVCEMFSGRGVVRTLGRPRLKQIIILPDIYNAFQEGLQKAITTSSPNYINNHEKRYTDKAVMGIMVASWNWKSIMEERSTQSTRY